MITAKVKSIGELRHPLITSCKNGLIVLWSNRNEGTVLSPGDTGYIIGQKIVGGDSGYKFEIFTGEITLANHTL